MGTQEPLITLQSGSGTCRDFALLLMEAVRSLGFAARFVSGYLYDDDRVGEASVVGGGATHAWAQIYLPGAGWVEFDPTNALVGGRNLIRVAVARDPSQAIPLSGSFTGAGNAFLGMTVEVEITAEQAPNVATGGRHMSDSVSGCMGDSVSGAAQRIAGGVQNAAEQAGHAACRAHAGVGEVREVIRAQPITAALVVFALGYLFGRLGALIPTGGTTRRI